MEHCQRDSTSKNTKGLLESCAAQSLAAAKKELDELMQKMNDAKELLAELNLLNQASQCIGTCTVEPFESGLPVHWHLHSLG